jgi:hypothetical protein
MVGKFQIQVNKHLCVPGIDLKTKCPQNRKKNFRYFQVVVVVDAGVSASVFSTFSWEPRRN